MTDALNSSGKPLRRWFCWKRVGFILGLTIAAVAIAALVHALRDVQFDQVLDAVRRTDPARIALAACFVGISYGSLTLYDLLALRAIGRREIPYRIAALANFTSYPIAHGTGAVLPVSAAIRYRVYSMHGLGAIEVAKICFLTGLTFWLGNLTALALSSLYEPSAIGRINQLSEDTNQLLAAALLGAVCCYVGWAWSAPRQVGRREWALTLPCGRMMLLQIGIGIVDLGAAALAIYTLMPPDMNIDFPRVVVVFIGATLLGFASHAPAGLGVFDATILLGLGGHDTEHLLAALLLFRLLYHLCPFLLALTAFLLAEWRNSLRGADALPGPARRD
jgi:uncharacterized membrane protein YbhN (UPF0104 family)